MGLFDSITNMVSGGGQKGYGDMQGQIQKGMDSLNDNYNQGRQQLAPYSQAGVNALNNYQDFYKQMANPQDYYNNVMSGWQMSPGAQMNQKYGTKAMNQSAAAGGTVGTPGQQEQVGQFMNNLVNTDQQNYFNNVNGIGNQYGTAQGNLMGQGFNSSNALLNSYMNQGNNMAGLYGSMGQAQLQQDLAKGGAYNDMFSMGANGFMNTKSGTNALNWLSRL